MMNLHIHKSSTFGNVYFSERRWFYREPDALPQRKELNKRRKTHAKKKILAVFLSLCMAMSLLPVTALAAEEAGTISEPTAGGNAFFANGTPITISAEAPADAKQVTFSNLNTDGEVTTYISWTNADGQLVYLAATQGLQFVFGGGNGAENPVSIASTSITMTGGKIRYLYGGNYGYDGKTEGKSSTVVGDVRISLSGSAVVGYVLYGGGKQNTSVKGTVYMDFNGVDLSSEKTDSCYVNGGVHGNGHEGTRNIEAGTMTTDAVANKVVINAVDSKFYLVGGGGGGSTKVNDADVTLTNCDVDYLYLSGINGEMEKSSLKATNCTVTGELAATNRGFVGTGRVDLNNCTVKNLNTGAAEGCFTSDSGTPDGSGVTGSVVWSLDDKTNVVAAKLTPLVVRTGEASAPNYATTYKNVTIQKEGTPLNVSVSDFTPVTTQGKIVTLKAFTVPENSTLILKGVEATVAAGNTLTNAGTIDMDDASSLTVASGATLKQAGTVNGDNVKVENGGTVTEYVARVGNNGYESLEDALDDVKASGGTITLLKDDTLENANYTIKGDVTITGTGTITATPAVPASDDASTHAFTITKDGSLTLDGVDLAISSNATTGKTYGFDVQYGGKLTLDNSDVTLSGLTNATISSKATDAGDAEPGVYTLTNSTITANNIRGNFSNGGTWTIGTGSKVTIDGCDSHGFSASAIIVENGAMVDIKNVAYRGISINDAKGKLEIQAGGVVNVTNAGTADDPTTPRDAVYLDAKATEGLIVKAGATLNVTAGKDGNDRIELSTEAVSKSELNGTIIGTVDLPEGASHWVVTYKDNGKNWKVELVAKNSATITLPEIPDQGYNHFQGWTDQNGKHYEGRQEVTISSNMTFTAVWTYIPPANPNYRIDIPAAEGGTVTADPAAAKAGATVTLTATPDEGYAVGTITVTDRFGDAVKVTENADGTYTFTMPNGQVTVKATFVETEEPAPAEPFPDVDENDWFYDEVVYVYENGLMNGVENNQFAPNTATNRAMLATILYRLAGQPDVSGDLPFTDVAAGTWYTDAVLWAAQNGIVNGLGENTFAPMNTLTREQLVTMLYRYAEAEGYDVSAAADLSGYPDAGKVQSYAQEAMSWAVAEGIVEGMDGNLNPAGNATRAQIATILMRFCEGVAK